MIMQLSNKIAVITGATSGIGLASAAAFTREGARVIGFARHDSQAAREVLGERGEFVRGDVTKAKDLEQLFARTREH
jgi:NAD(P)-dependent dehydrogenase (short-subunit alcohol dehydrogenase family)